jgi:hypothetical protein
MTWDKISIIAGLMLIIGMPLFLILEQVVSPLAVFGGGAVLTLGLLIVVIRKADS